MNEAIVYIVFKFDGQGDLDLKSYYSQYGGRKPPARTYDMAGKAKAQWNRYQRSGYGARAARIWMNEEGDPEIDWCDHEWVLPPELCRHRWRPALGDHVCEFSWCPHHTLHSNSVTCYRRKGHKGIHWSGVEAKRDPDYDPEMKESCVRES